MGTDEYEASEGILEKHRALLSVSPIGFPESTSFPLYPCPSVSSVFSVLQQTEPRPPKDLLILAENLLIP
jgi:hypothetical protein